MSTAPPAGPGQEGTEDAYEFEPLAEARNYRRAILKEFSPWLAGDVLEVGAGVGQFTAELAGCNPIRRLSVVEPDPGFCGQIREKCSGVEVIEGPVTAIEAQRAFDAVVAVNVLEHIEDDVGELRRYRTCLQARKGAVCLFVPAGPELYAPLDRQFGHYRRYSRGGLRDALASAGFSTVYLRYFNFPGYFLWWLEFCVFKQREFRARRVWLFDRLVFPAIHFIESRCIRPPKGQSLIAVAKAVGR